MKKGFLNPDAQQWIGEVIVADICVPPALLAKHGRPLAMTFDTAPDEDASGD